MARKPACVSDASYARNRVSIAGLPSIVARVSASRKVQIVLASGTASDSPSSRKRMNESRSLIRNSVRSSDSEWLACRIRIFHVFMWKILILQASHSLSDERTEFLIKDRLSFMRFLELGLSDAVPDANTIWTFREALTRATIDGKPAIETLFRAYEASDAGGFPGHGRSDHRRLDRGGPEAA